MALFRDDFARAVLTPGNERGTSWIKSSRIAVLAVVMVQKDGDPAPRFIRGVNSEMYTIAGTLCAERSALAAALASDLALRKRDIKAVAVLNMPKLFNGGVRRDVHAIDADIRVALEQIKACSVAPSAVAERFLALHDERRCLVEYNEVLRGCERGERHDDELNPMGPCAVCSGNLNRLKSGGLRVFLFTDKSLGEVVEQTHPGSYSRPLRLGSGLCEVAK
jgi:cytidine deaminase